MTSWKDKKNKNNYFLFKFMYGKHNTNSKTSKNINLKNPLVWFLGISIIVFISFSLSQYAGTNTVYARRDPASGLYLSAGIGDRKRLIDFQVEITGFTSSRAGTFIGSTESGQPAIILVPSQINTVSDPGNEGQDNQRELPEDSGESLAPQHKGSPEQQKIIDYAWEISHDKTFLYLLKAENGKIAINTKSKQVGSNGYRDYGTCQINKGYHPEIVNDKRFFTDYKWQLEQCYRLYKGGTVFYGLKRLQTNPSFKKKIISSFS